MKFYKFKGLLQQHGWMACAYVGVDVQGLVQYLSDKRPAESVAVEDVNGYALPGFRNAHSHAFQFAMAGLAEIHRPGVKDDFWSWREAMYQCALSMRPDQLESIAAMLYSEMLSKGYTHVAEFHYLHHDEQGQGYSNPAEMGERLVSAANTAGIKITLVPVFYQKGNFGKAPEPRQVRFISKTIGDYLQLLEYSSNVVSRNSEAQLGYGVHSLRAVNHTDVIKTFQEGPATIPFHLHAAEQIKEVEDCVAYTKRRPIEWLLENLPVNERFHIVHCTHMNDSEVTALARSKANVVLCPGTEANLGDGVFRLTEFATQGGTWSLGTDSHISLNPLEDIRWLDYGQRLTSHRRNTFDNGAQNLLTKVYFSGQKAMSSADAPLDFFERNKPFDAVVYRSDSPLLSRPGLENLLSTIIYTADPSCILGTLVNGRWVVKNNVHYRMDTIKRAFKRALKSLSR